MRKSLNQSKKPESSRGKEASDSKLVSVLNLATYIAAGIAVIMVARELIKKVNSPDLQPVPLQQPGKVSTPQNTERLPEAERIKKIPEAIAALKALGIKVEIVNPEGIPDGNLQNPLILLATLHPDEQGNIRKGDELSMWRAFQAVDVLLKHRVIESLHAEGLSSREVLPLGNLKFSSGAPSLPRAELRTMLSTNFSVFRSALQASGNRGDKLLAAVCPENFLIFGAENPATMKSNFDTFKLQESAYEFLSPIIDLLKQYGEPRIARNPAQQILLVWGEHVYELREVEEACRDIVTFEKVQRQREEYAATLGQCVEIGASHASHMKRLVPVKGRSLVLISTHASSENFESGRVREAEFISIIPRVALWKAKAMNPPQPMVPGQLPNVPGNPFFPQQFPKGPSISDPLRR